MPIALIAVSAALTFSFAQDARLVVVVADDFGRPIQGAHIRVTLEETDDVIASAQSAGDGTATISVIPLRPYVIDVALIGYESPGGGVHAFPPAGEVAVSLRLRPIEAMPELEINPATPIPNGVLEGRVLSFEGEPVADVGVEARRGYTSYQSTRTRADGSYRMSVPPGTYHVRSGGRTSAPPQSPSRAASFVAYEPGDYEGEIVVRSGLATKRVDIHLRELPSFAVTVTVVNDKGERVANAEVRSTHRRHLQIEHTFHSRWSTDANGVVQLGPISRGPVRITATAGEGAAQVAGAAAIEVLDAPVNDVTIMLLPGARAVGRVQFLDRSSPLHGGSGLRVLAYSPDSSPSGQLQGDPNGIVDPDGHFTLTGLAGEQCLHIVGIPVGWRLLDITYDGQDVTGRALPFEPRSEMSDVLIRVEPGDALLRPQPTCK